ncbi:MAG: IS110 family transposase [Pseudooceanicola sp.]|nr:IS110 family transposase [Pseudooceanicola sp.]MDF1856253.1 IS110 family transposase [Pseudooceanicola sp.]
MQVTTVGLDLAKTIFHVHGVTEDGQVAFNRPLRRSQVLAFFQRLAPCLVGIEACASSHHRGRELSRLGHTVRLMPPMYVKPYVKRGKFDAVDAEAICEAVTRPTMRFVEIKSEEQQALLSLHRARDFVVRQSTQLINMLRSLAAEFGIVLARGVARAIDFAKGITEGGHTAQPFQRWQGTIGQDHQDGRPVSAAAHRGRHDVSRPTGRQSPPPWLADLLQRKPARLATVAMANKTARIMWAVLTKNEPYRPHAAWSK